MAEKIARTRLLELLEYDNETGLFKWRDDFGSHARKNKIAGSIDGNGYRVIRLDKRLYRAHHLAWLYAYGAWPSKNIDHIDADRANNRLSNLRLANQSENSANARKKNTNTSGFKGVHWHPQTQKWRVRLCHNYRYIQIGMYLTREDAATAYAHAARTHFGEFARTS